MLRNIVFLCVEISGLRRIAENFADADDALAVGTFNAAGKNDAVDGFMNDPSVSNCDFLLLQESGRGHVKQAKKSSQAWFTVGFGVATVWNKDRWQVIGGKRGHKKVAVKGDSTYSRDGSARLSGSTRGGSARRGSARLSGRRARLSGRRAKSLPVGKKALAATGRDGTCQLSAFRKRDSSDNALVVNCHMGHNKQTWKQVKADLEREVSQEAKELGLKFNIIVFGGDLNEMGVNMAKAAKTKGECPCIKFLGKKITSFDTEKTHYMGNNDNIFVWGDDVPKMEMEKLSKFGSDHNAVMVYTVSEQ